MRRARPWQPRYRQTAARTCLRKRRGPRVLLQGVLAQKRDVGRSRDPLDEAGKGVLIGAVNGTGDQASERNVQVQEQWKREGNADLTERQAPNRGQAAGPDPQVDDDGGQEQDHGAVMREREPQECRQDDNLWEGAGRRVRSAQGTGSR